MEKQVSLSLELVNAIINYLSTRPWREVYQLINGIDAVVSPQLTNQAQPTQQTEIK